MTFRHPRGRLGQTNLYVTNPHDFAVPNVCDWKPTVGKLMTALRPYRDFPEVREHMAALEEINPKELLG